MKSGNNISENKGFILYNTLVLFTVFLIMLTMKTKAIVSSKAAALQLQRIHHRLSFEKTALIRALELSSNEGTLLSDGGCSAEMIRDEQLVTMHVQCYGNYIISVEFDVENNISGYAFSEVN